MKRLEMYKPPDECINYYRKCVYQIEIKEIMDVLKMETSSNISNWGTVIFYGEVIFYEYI